VKPLSPDCSGFQVAGISHSAGTSTYSLNWGLSDKTILSRATESPRVSGIRWCPDYFGVASRASRCGAARQLRFPPQSVAHTTPVIGGGCDVVD
jgi:hypothetical protein